MDKNINRSERKKREVYAGCLLGALIGILGGLLGPLSLLLTLAGIGVVVRAVVLLRDLLKKGEPEMEKVECDCFRPAVRLRAFPRSAYTLREYHSNSLSHPAETGQAAETQRRREKKDRNITDKNIKKEVGV